MEVDIYRGPGSRCLTRGVPTEAADNVFTTASGDVLSIPVLTLKQKAFDYFLLSRFELCSFGNAAPLKERGDNPSLQLQIYEAYLYFSTKGRYHPL